MQSGMKTALEQRPILKAAKENLEYLNKTKSKNKKERTTRKR